MGIEQLNNLIGKWVSGFSINVITDRTWVELASILAPSALLILILFGIAVSLENKTWRSFNLWICLLVTIFYLPYELYRQSSNLVKAQTNIGEVQTNLKLLLDSAHLNHVGNLIDEEVSSHVLGEMIHSGEKKDLLYISWLLSENEKKLLAEQENKQKMIVNELNSALSNLKQEIVETQEPVEKIANDILSRIDGTISQLIESKIQHFNQALNQSLENFQSEINTFVQNELNTYQAKLTEITQQNTDELQSYTRSAKQTFADQINQTNKESLQKLDETTKSIDQMKAALGGINFEQIVGQVQQLSNSIKSAQERNEALFEYNECIRTAGIIDLIGKEEDCKKKLNNRLNELTHSNK